MWIREYGEDVDDVQMCRMRMSISYRDQRIKITEDGDEDEWIQLGGFRDV